MKIVHYTRTCYLDHSLSLVRAMSSRADVHLLVEISPEGLVGGSFGEETLAPHPVGVHDAEPALRRGYLVGATEFVSNLASFSLVVHGDRRALSQASLRTGLAAAARVRVLRPDILHIEEESARALPLFLLTPGTPKVLAIHDVKPHPGEGAGRQAIVRRLATSHSARLLCYSRYSQSLLAREFPRRPSSQVPLGVKEVLRAWPGPAISERRGTLLFFGRIAPYKGLDVMYRALPRIAKQIPHLRVVVAGQPSPNYQLPARPSLPPTVEFETLLHTVDRATLHRLFQEASIVVLPYVEASQSGVIQTAYAFDKPVVASALAGLAEVICDGVTGHLVPPGAPQPLAEAAIDLLLDDNRRIAMQASIRAHVQQTSSWHSIAQDLSDVYSTTATAARSMRGQFPHSRHPRSNG
jgi:alpha-maltose-1-phosphate synthase